MIRDLPISNITLFQYFSYTVLQYFDLAADVLAENTHLTYKCLSPYLYDFIDAKITQQTSPEEVSWITVARDRY